MYRAAFTAGRAYVFDESSQWADGCMTCVRNCPRAVRVVIHGSDKSTYPTISDYVETIGICTRRIDKINVNRIALAALD